MTNVANGLYVWQASSRGLPAAVNGLSWLEVNSNRFWVGDKSWCGNSEAVGPKQKQEKKVRGRWRFYGRSVAE